ncbi:hypothetical protein COBT_002474 [Conglomerata obtusa]
MLYIAPVSIHLLQKKLNAMGMICWKVDKTGLTFTVNYSSNAESADIYVIHFRGISSVHYTEDGRVFAYELDFDPVVGKKEAYSILYEIESFLKDCDAVFFMAAEVDIDSEILSNPLSQSVEFLYKRIEEHNEMM